MQPTTTFADLGADDLDLVELIMELEESFSIAIPDDKIESLMGGKDWERGKKNVTIEKLAALVDECRKQRPH